MGRVGETRGKQRWMGGSGRNWRETEMDGGEWERLEGNRDRWGRVEETGGKQR